MKDGRPTYWRSLCNHPGILPACFFSLMGFAAGSMREPFTLWHCWAGLAALWEARSWIAEWEKKPCE